jgi:hypothetical protein
LIGFADPVIKIWNKAIFISAISYLLKKGYGYDHNITLSPDFSGHGFYFSPGGCDDPHKGAPGPSRKKPGPHGTILPAGHDNQPRRDGAVSPGL